MIIREHYLKKIRPFVESDLIKIITGIRRCGKSVIMGQLEAELRAAGKRTLKLNFEDRSVGRTIRNADELITAVEAQLTEEKLYVFLDEIQTVKEWNIACRSLRLKNLSLFITGSNSKLLSREFTNELSGRYVALSLRVSRTLAVRCSIETDIQHYGLPYFWRFSPGRGIRREGRSSAVPSGLGRHHRQQGYPKPVSGATDGALWAVDGFCADVQFAYFQCELRSEISAQ